MLKACMSCFCVGIAEKSGATKNKQIELDFVVDFITYYTFDVDLMVFL